MEVNFFIKLCHAGYGEKHPFNDKRYVTKSPMPTLYTRHEHVGGRGRGQSPGPTEPRPHTGPVHEVERVVRRHRALPSASQ